MTATENRYAKAADIIGYSHFKKLPHIPRVSAEINAVAAVI